MKTIGIIGGIGPQATMYFEQKIHEVSQQLVPQNGNSGYPPLLVYYMRQAPILLDEKGQPALPLQQSPELLDIAHVLGSRSDFLVMVCNTPHFFYQQVKEAAGKDILSIVEVTLEEIKRRQLKKVGILAIGGTLRNKLYQDALHTLGIGWVTIPDELVDKLDKSIFGVMEGRIEPGLVTHAQAAIAYLRDQGADGIILGCTEIPFLLQDELAASSDLLNPTDLLAEAAVRLAIQ